MFNSAALSYREAMNNFDVEFELLTALPIEITHVWNV
jgi:hypothetical protein